VAVVAVDIVHVILVGHGSVTTAVLVDVHVAGVRDVELAGVDRGLEVIHVILVDVVDVPVVQEVDVVLVGHRGVPAEPVVHVGMLPERVMGSGFWHATSGRHGSPNGRSPQTMVPGLKPSGARQTQTGYDDSASICRRELRMTESPRRCQPGTTRCA
jgi:hypothetical protein